MGGVASKSKRKGNIPDRKNARRVQSLDVILKDFSLKDLRQRRTTVWAHMRLGAGSFASSG